MGLPAAPVGSGCELRPCVRRGKTTRLGRVRGNQLEMLGRKVEEYRGIPFAQPPVGRLRFLPPKPAKPWDGILDATNRRTACSQVRFSSIMASEIEYTEDCLHLNIWSPAVCDEDLVPVVVWIYGGGFTTGCASYGKLHWDLQLLPRLASSSSQ
ncbi:hypothetical protein HPB49_007922 [Dermacentor silvarum]|uniref:Uncharacterized protein n=1 Tax=Dermacentor silvarum TaxID=543639 RepID=A0ACB8C2M4_DERSI|nr:acetylcholinesterase-like [Dermacentor silvarum]KAH7933080.1 hypothetical protein HPB49_007922 [Dermacentor silvarum]